MAEPIDTILEYLRQNNFMTAEAALKSELKIRYSEQDHITKVKDKDLVVHSNALIQSSQMESAELPPNLRTLEKPYISVATPFSGKAVYENQAKDLVGNRDIYSCSTHYLDKSDRVETLPFDLKSGTYEEKILTADVLHNECHATQKTVNSEKLSQEVGAFQGNISLPVNSKIMQEIGPGNGSTKLLQKEGIEPALPYGQWHSSVVSEAKNELLWLSSEGIDSGFRIEKTGLQHGKIYPLDEVGSPHQIKFSCSQHEEVQMAMLQKPLTAMALEDEKSSRRLHHGVLRHDENALQIGKETAVQKYFPTKTLNYREDAPYRQEPCNLSSEKSNVEDIERFWGFSKQGILIESHRGDLPSSTTWQEGMSNVTYPSSTVTNLKNAHQHIQLPRSCSSDREGYSTQSSTGSAAAQDDLQVGSGIQQQIAFACDTDQNVLEVCNAEGDIPEGLPRLPPVRLKSWDKMLEPTKELFGLNLTSSEENNYLNTETALESTFGLGSFLDVPVGQDISSSGGKRLTLNRPSVSQGIVEDTSELLSNFATAGDCHSESVVGYPDDYWDSDAYEDDDDPGYLRQPIDDEAWFLANELFYPIEDGRSRPNRDFSQGQIMNNFKKGEDDEHSFVDSFFSGEEVYQSREVLKEYGEELEELPKPSNLSPGKVEHEELKQTKAEPGWQGFVGKDNLYKDDKETNMNIFDNPQTYSLSVGNSKSSDLPLANKNPGRHSLMVEEPYLGKNCDKKVLEDLGDNENSASPSALSRTGMFPCADNPFSYSSISRDCLNGVAGGCFGDQERHSTTPNYLNGAELNATLEIEDATSDMTRCKQNVIAGSYQMEITNVDIYSQKDKTVVGINSGGFSFPSPSSAGDMAATRSDSGKVKCARDVLSQRDEADAHGSVGPDDTLASWRRQSNESSPIIGSRDAHHFLGVSGNSTGSGHSTDESQSKEESRLEVGDVGGQRADTDAGAYLDDVAAVQEQIQRLQAEEDDYEIFDLRIIHRKNRTGFEEEKDFPVVINSVIAGRYHVTEYLGSAAFSKAIQAHDLHTGMDVCMKIIKNNKDFFDQSLDEIKLLKYINRHDPADKHHILRLYDYFYHREHLFIVCELLRANLYEFHKYNRESGGEVYFTMPRLQCITRQCLEALDFLHGLGLIHCDLKPENILVKSYSRCEVKVIDLGSSCFQTDHLCSYVQSRSYRAPEVILGLPYDQKIDIWSLGCILAELCSGNVLFQNDSLATLLARVIGILGPVDLDMLAKGHDTHKYFTKSHKLYERNPDTDRLEYLLPKKTSLAHRLPMGDQGFVDFVDYLLQADPQHRPLASEALKHPWLSFPYEPISS